MPAKRRSTSDLAAEAHQFGRPAAGLRRHAARLLHQALLLDEPAEILLVQPPPGQRLDRALQLQQGEALAGINSNTTGRYLILARKRAMPVARMRRWSCIIGVPGTGRRLGRAAAASGTSPAS